MRVYEVRRGSRSRRILLGAALVVFALVALLIYLVVAKAAVVPGVSQRVYPIEYQDGIRRAAEKYDVDPYLVAAVVRTESGYDPEAVSHAGAVGLMQLLPTTAEWIVGLDSWKGGTEVDLTDPDDSLELGAFYLAFLLRRFEGDQRAAIAAYNAGQGIVGEWVSAAEGGSLGLEDVRFPETRTFVLRVEESLDLYRRVHPDIFGRSGPV